MVRIRARRLLIVLGAAFATLAVSGISEGQVRSRVRKLPHDKLDSALAQLIAGVESGQPRALALSRLQNPLADRSRVPISLRVHDVDAATTWLRIAGAPVLNSAPGVIETYATPDVLRQLSGSANVLRVSQILPPRARAVTQGIDIHNARNWHASGRAGAGVKVGIVDVGFSGFSNLMGSELPASVTARCYSAVGAYAAALAACERETPHGTAVAETLVDLAPGVQLFIANPISYLDFRETLDWMTAMGVRVINFSANTLWDGPGDGTSPYADSPLAAVDSAVAAGAVFVAAAGNEAEATYLGPFIDHNANEWAEFGAGADDNAVFLDAGETIMIQLRWDDSWGSSSRDLDLALYDGDRQLVASSVAPQDGSPGSVPFEFVSYAAATAGTYYIGVVRYSGSTPAWLQLQNFTSQGLARFTAGSIGSPAETANAGALAVGAAPWYAPSTIEWFSSRGPTPDGRLKPDLVGVDRADTASYGPSRFAGTSQASPHIAALAALVFQAFPGSTPAAVTGYLKAVAAPGSGPRPSNVWGYGLSVLPNACTYSLSPASVTLPWRAATFSIAVTTTAGCAWEAVSQASYVRITAGAAGSASGVVDVAIDANAGPRPRTTMLTIGGHQVPIVQGARPARGDFDGDGLADVSVFRPSNGTWYHRFSGSGAAAGVQWGSAVDVPLPGDYDGGGTTDVAVFRAPEGVWYLRYTESGAAASIQWGGGLDVPVPADYDGDGATDVAVFRPSSGVWYIRYANGSASGFEWGGEGDVPVPADYDGDGTIDVAVFRPSTGMWYVRFTNSGAAMDVQWGSAQDIAVPGDYDGDGRADMAVYRPSVGVWYLRYSSTGASAAVHWGGEADQPVPADYDGDGRTDIAVFRPSNGTWYLRYSTAGATAGVQWGSASDIPVTRPR